MIYQKERAYNNVGSFTLVNGSVVKTKICCFYNELILFCKTPRTRKEICDYLGLNSVTYAIQTHVMPLVDKGIIKMSIPDKPKSPKQLFYSEL